MTLAPDTIIDRWLDWCAALPFWNPITIGAGLAVMAFSCATVICAPRYSLQQARDRSDWWFAALGRAGHAALIVSAGSTVLTVLSSGMARPHEGVLYLALAASLSTSAYRAMKRN